MFWVLHLPIWQGKGNGTEFEITINLNQGESIYTMYSSDLSPEYIDFNRSEYAYWKQARKDGLV